MSESTTSLVLIMSLVFAVAALGLAFKLWRDLLDLKNSLGGIFTQAEDGNLQDLLRSIQQTNQEHQSLIKGLQSALREISLDVGQSLQKTAIIRFNPFRDEGQPLSFAVAMLDQFDTGVVISSLHAREGTRVYAQPIRQGKCPYELREEEREVLRRAMQEA